MTRPHLLAAIVSAVIIAVIAIVFATTRPEKDGCMEDNSPEQALDEYYSVLVSRKISESGNTRVELTDIASDLIRLEVSDRKKTREGCELIYVLILGNIHGQEQPELTKTKKAEMIQEGEIWKVKNITDI